MLKFEIIRAALFESMALPFFYQNAVRDKNLYAFAAVFKN